MARVEAAEAVSSVWTRTLASYRKELTPKELNVIEGLTSPTDIVKHLENLEAKRHAGKRGVFADRIYSITGRLTQFSSLINILTSSNTEASLIWGSLKLLLTIVHQSAEEYEKICQSILAVGESFPTVDLVATTFDHSELVCSHVVAFYESVLQFWSKALKFYKRKRIFNIFRAWHDFDSEFGELDRDMRRHGRAIEKAAAAVHMNESKTARLEQTAINRQLIEATRSAVTSDRHRDIVQWLAPFNHEASYFADDLRSAYESHHPGTCTWILERPEFKAWMNSDPNDVATRLLWLTGVPGAGKTVLSSCVISSCSEVPDKDPPTPTLYFFFKMTDSDKNSVLSVTRSLVYQLYSLFPASLCADIVSLRDGSGKDKALSDQRLWDLFVKHARDLADLTIVLDALDECDGVDVLLGRMIALLDRSRAKIFVVSRKEESIALALEEYPYLIITPRDIEADIHSYVMAEIERIPRFRGKPVQQKMISALSSGHGGMFLWAYLMIKELKELGTVRQVDETLRSLPRGLEKMHESIITRLDATLSSAYRQLAIKILMWIVCAVRPLRLVELQEIMRFEFRESRTSSRPSIDDDDLLYSEKDMELACGALVISRNGTLQLIHLSTKEILLKKPSQMLSGDPRLDFYVDAQRENLHMATLCISYISSHLSGIGSLTRPNLTAGSRLQLTKESYDSTDLVTKSPFIGYASISWQVHLVDGEINPELEDIMRQLQTLLTCDLTILWIELCVSLHQDIIWTMERSCKETIAWADYASVPPDSSCHEAIAFLWAWSNGVLSIIEEYGRVIKVYPYEIHYLDLENVLRYNCAPGSPVLLASYTATPTQALRERISEIRTIDKHSASVKVDPCRQLQLNVETPTWSFSLGFVIYDSKREVYITAESEIRNETEVLWVQERATGRRLPPVRGPLSGSDILFQDLESPPSRIAGLRLQLIHAVLSRDCTYLAVLYSDEFSPGDFITSIWIIEDRLDFHGIRHKRPWARRLHCFRTRAFGFFNSCLPLTAGWDGLFYCPSGQIHPEHGIQKQIPSAFRTYPYARGKCPVFAFAGDGQTLIRLDQSNGLVERDSWLEDTVTEPWQFPMPASHTEQERVYLRAISRTAGFMVYETTLKDESPVVFYLLDYQGKLEQLQVDNSGAHRSAFFYFSRDEQYLLGIYPAGQGKPNQTHFSRWAMSKPSFIPQEETILFVPGFSPYSNTWALFPIAGTVCVVEEDLTIVLVTGDRVVYEVDLKDLNFKAGNLATTRGINFPYQPYCHRDYRVSNNGYRIVGLYLRCPGWSDDTTCGHVEEHPASLDLGKTHLELKIFDLSGTADQVQKLELEYSDPESPAFHEHVITFSPDLSIVQAGAHIFDLMTPGHPRLYFPDSPLDKLRHRENSCISFSACNHYLVLIEGKSDAATDEPATFGLFRICRMGGNIEKLAIAGLDDLVVDVTYAAFHPTLPLLVLTCITRREHDIRDAAKSITAIEVDAEALKFAHINIPKHELAIPERDTMYYRRSILNARAQFSDCGSFCFLNHFPYAILILKSDLLKAKAAKMQAPAVWGLETSYNQRFYEVSWRDESTTVNLYQAIDRPRKDGFRDSTYIRYPPENTISVAITALPFHLVQAGVYLLVGKDGDDLVRVLFLPKKGPPEIKDLRVTLNQILEKLAARSAEVTHPYRVRSEETSEEEASDVRSEEVAVSADEDDLRILDSGSEESSDTNLEEVAISANEDEPGRSDSD